MNSGSVEFEPMSTDEICSLSLKLGRNKAVDADDIPVEVYKYGSPTLFRVLAYIFNKMLSNKSFPSKLMKVNLVPMINNKTSISSDRETIGLLHRLRLYQSFSN